MFFDSVSRSWLVRFLEHRIGDLQDDAPRPLRTGRPPSELRRQHAERPSRLPAACRASPSASAASRRFNFHTQGLQPLDVFLDGRPLESRDIADGLNLVIVFGELAEASMELHGFDGGHLAAARTVIA